MLLSTSLWAQNNCSAGSIQGEYGFVSTIRHVPPPNGPVKHVVRERIVGVIYYDGAGTAKVAGVTVTPGGQTSPFTGTGAYQVGANCVGSVTFQNISSKWDFVLVSGGNELLTITQAPADTTPLSQ